MAGRDVSDVVVVDAPAKLTLSLRITGVRDDGYHFIDAEMVTLDWHDVVTIDPTSRGLTVDGPYAAGVPLDVIAVSRFSNDAARRALEDRGVQTVSCDLFDRDA